VSDFLSRVAARAVGAAPVAGPRLPSAFEGGGPAGEAGPEVVDGEALATAAPRPSATTPGPEARGVERVAPPAAGTALSRVGAGEPDGIAPAAHVPSEVGRPASFIATPERENRAVEAVPALLPERDPGPPVAAAAADLPAADVPAAVVPRAGAPVVVAARPAAAAVPRAARPREPEPGAATAAGEIEPPPVRVHIGRLEVRANLQQPAPQRPHRDEERPPELSLPDYLRGKRVAS
jgi:hypothetical protein